ncbi:helix-turn-helix domain-containing protein [Streptosporangium roseum]|uniref:helix-turn-helix domain-containing protein n=1 Tax=Streptosporangium roseum TaxID=2001 RepID=UPI003AFAFE9B
MTVPETAQLLGIHRDTVYDAVRRGDIPSIRVGNSILMPTSPEPEVDPSAVNLRDAAPKKHSCTAAPGQDHELYRARTWLYQPGLPFGLPIGLPGSTKGPATTMAYGVTFGCLTDTHALCFPP